MAETSETAYKAYDVLWIAFDPAIGKRALLNEVYTERPDDWALRYRLDDTQEPGVVVTSDRDSAIAAAARREERARIVARLNEIACEQAKLSAEFRLKGDDEDASMRAFSAGALSGFADLIESEAT